MSQPSPSPSAPPPSTATASASSPNAPRRSVQILRRTIAIIIVVAFSLAAAGGIIVLLGDIESEATFQVISTTALTGAVSVTAFCGATLLGRRNQWFGIVTIGVLLALIGVLVHLLGTRWLDIVMPPVVAGAAWPASWTANLRWRPTSARCGSAKRPTGISGTSRSPIMPRAATTK